MLCAASALARRRATPCSTPPATGPTLHGCVSPRHRPPPQLETIKKNWEHIFLCKGIAADSMWMLFPRLKEVGATHVVIKQDIECYRWPKHQTTWACGSAFAFGGKRWQSCIDANTFKLGAPETLSIFPPLLEITAAHRVRLPAEYACFNNLCPVIDTILGMKYGHVEISDATCRQLHSDIEDHFARHIKLYGAAHITPKWHEALHLPRQFLNDKLVVDTIANERNHQNCKAFGDLMKGHMPAFEKFVISRSICFQMGKLERFSEYNQLEGQVKWSHAMGAYLGSAISFNGAHVPVKQFVIWNSKVLLVQICGRTNTGELFVVGVHCEVHNHYHGSP